MPFIDDEQLAALYKEVDQEEGYGLLSRFTSKEQASLIAIELYQYSAILFCFSPRFIGFLFK